MKDTNELKYVLYARKSSESDERQAMSIDGQLMEMKEKAKREIADLDVNYSKSEMDLGNMESYEEFLEALFQIYKKIYTAMKPKGYITIIIKNVKKEGKLYPLAWDLAKKLSEIYVLKDEKIWAQDKVGLAPYGYPHAWVSNIIHHYCLILRKE